MPATPIALLRLSSRRRPTNDPWCSQHCLTNRYGCSRHRPAYALRLGRYRLTYRLGQSQCRPPFRLTQGHCLGRPATVAPPKADMNKGGLVVPFDTLNRYTLQIVLTQVITHAEAVQLSILQCSEARRYEGGHEQGQICYALCNL